MQVDVNMTFDPPKEFRTLEKSKEHVKYLLSSFQRSGTINDQVILVFFFDPADPKHACFLNIDRDNFNLNDHKDLLEGNLNAVAGMHTMEAV